MYIQKSTPKISSKERIRIKSADADFSFWSDAEKLMAEGKGRLAGKQKFSFSFEMISNNRVLTEKCQSFFHTGILLAFLGSLIFYVIFMTANDPVGLVWALLAGGIALSGIFLAVVFFKPAEYITFISHTGNPLFGVIRTKKNSAKVEELFALISSHKLAQKKAEQ
jgi:hypothetical protein